MRPRRTFESVVSELITGLEAGEIALNDQSISIVAPSRTTAPSPMFFVAGTPIHHVHSADATQKLMKALWSELYHVAKTAVEERDVEKTVAKTHDRIWLVVGSEKSFDVLWKILLTSKLGSASHREYDTRIIVSGFKDSHQDWIEKLQRFGLADHVRVAATTMDGWVAFADSNLYVDLPDVWRERTPLDSDDYRSPVSIDIIRGTVHHRSLFAVEKRSNPDEFRNIEASFLELWQTSSDR